MQPELNESLVGSNRVKRGFHRIGIMLLVLSLIFGFVASARDAWHYFNFGGNLTELISSYILPILLWSFLMGIFFYSICRAIGWIIAGFSRS